jgi:uncharacterized cupredoxin-like copper-binding protein
MRRALPRLSTAASVGVGLALLIAGCSGGSPSPHSGAGRIRVVERDFHIKAPARARAGVVTLSVLNKGPADHEFIVVRQRGPRLPLRRDGLTVDEDAVDKATVTAIEPALPGTVNERRVRLAPGTYDLLCNMYGHYLGGMHRRLVVQ